MITTAPSISQAVRREQSEDSTRAVSLPKVKDLASEFSPNLQTAVVLPSAERPEGPQGINEEPLRKIQKLGDEYLAYALQGAAIRK